MQQEMIQSEFGPLNPWQLQHAAGKTVPIQNNQSPLSQQAHVAISNRNLVINFENPVSLQAIPMESMSPNHITANDSHNF